MLRFLPDPSIAPLRDPLLLRFLPDASLASIYLSIMFFILQIITTLKMFTEDNLKTPTSLLWLLSIKHTQCRHTSKCTWYNLPIARYSGNKCFGSLLLFWTRVTIALTRDIIVTFLDVNINKKYGYSYCSLIHRFLPDTSLVTSIAPLLLPDPLLFSIPPWSIPYSPIHRLLPDLSLAPDQLLLWLLCGPSLETSITLFIAPWSIAPAISPWSVPYSCSLINCFLPDRSLFPLLMIHRLFPIHNYIGRLFLVHPSFHIKTINPKKVLFVSYHVYHNLINTLILVRLLLLLGPIYLSHVSSIAPSLILR